MRFDLVAKTKLEHSWTEAQIHLHFAGFDLSRRWSISRILVSAQNTHHARTSCYEHVGDSQCLSNTNEGVNAHWNEKFGGIPEIKPKFNQMLDLNEHFGD